MNDTAQNSFFQIRKLGEVTSTNDVIKEAISKGEQEGLVVTAISQTGGYGRRGNPLTSQPGGLYMSLLLRPDVNANKLQSLGLLAAIAVCRLIASFLPAEQRGIVQIKWPNDVVIMFSPEQQSSIENSRPKQSSSNLDNSSNPANCNSHSFFNKICGISVESKDGAVCVGIGINVRHHLPDPSTYATDIFMTEKEANKTNATDVERIRSNASETNATDATKTGTSLKAVFSSNPRNIPTYLEDLSTSESFSIDMIRDRFLVEFADLYPTWQHDGFSPFRKEFLQRFALEGFKIRIDDCSSDPIKCEVLDINNLGHLIVLPEGDTKPKTIASGSITIIDNSDQSTSN